jgi:hypothetical protein
VTIAFDFDHTITADPATMLAAMHLFKQAGHTVIVATLRHNSEYEAVDRIIRGGFPVVYCCRNIKAPMCHQAGYSVDVWVDDMPEFCRETLLLGSDKDL